MRPGEDGRQMEPCKHNEIIKRARKRLMGR